MGLFIECSGGDGNPPVAPITIYSTANNDSYLSFERRFNSKVIINTPQNGGDPYSYPYGEHPTISGLFTNCYNFNQPVELPNWYWQDFYGVFHNCTNFNQPITIPNSCHYVSILGMFSGCTNFNQPITIPNACGGYYDEGRNLHWAASFDSIFYHCTNFNSPVIFDDGVWEQLTSCEFMFRDCVKFNHPVDLMNNPINWSWLSTKNNFFVSAKGMFYNCASLCQEIHFPNTVDDLRFTLYSCTNMRNVYIHNDNIRLFYNAYYAFGSFVGNRASTGANYHRINIFCNNQQQLLGSNYYSVVGSPVTWEYDSVSGCYYNSYQNIYICPMK